MAKRKAGRAASRKGAARKGAVKKSARKTARGGARKAARKTASRKGAARKGAARAARKAVARKAMARKTSARKKVARTAAPKRAASKTAVRRATKRAAPKAASKAAPVRKAPALNRARRTVTDEDLVLQTPPSSLDLDRSASAVRSGRRGMRDRYSEHTETSPAMTGGDVDADWESAYSVGDEAPGGDNPTPDQDIVDDIGRAVGVEYQDNEELKGENKLLERDKHRWELDPASSEDYDERD
jgi:hypothetical protein